MNTCARSLFHIISDFHWTRVMNTAVRSICQIINIFYRAKGYVYSYLVIIIAFLVTSTGQQLRIPVSGHYVG